MQTYTIHNHPDAPLFTQRIFSPGECAQLLRLVDHYEPARVNVGDGRQALEPETRQCARCIVDAPAVAAHLFARIRHLLPQEMPGGYRLEGLNERLRILWYAPGDYFRPHQDGNYQHENGTVSLLTLQVYLNTLPLGAGGETIFKNGNQLLKIRPVAGMILVFDQALWHEGATLLQGDVMYRLHTL